LVRACGEAAAYRTQTLGWRRALGGLRTPGAWLPSLLAAPRAAAT